MAGAVVHPDCVNSSNPFHECSEYCFKKIAERKLAGEGVETDAPHSADTDLPTSFGRPVRPKRRREEAQAEDQRQSEEQPAEERPQLLQGLAGGDDGEREVEEEQAGDDDPVEDMNNYEGMSARQKKLFDLRLKLNKARKANQTAIVAERKRSETPQETRGMSKQKWFEEKQRKVGKALEANGLDIKQAYMLDTQEDAEAKYKKYEKKDAAFGWDIFNQKSLYNGYKKRTKNIATTVEEYNRAKAGDPEFYRDGASLQYGKAPDLPEENIDRMVNELKETAAKRKDFSRRRTYHEEKDIDSINDRNEHFNRKIERAFGKYTLEIKTNLERGTALPD